MRSNEEAGEGYISDKIRLHTALWQKNLPSCEISKFEKWKTLIFKKHFSKSLDKLTNCQKPQQSWKRITKQTYDFLNVLFCLQCQENWNTDRPSRVFSKVYWELKKLLGT